MKISDLLDRYKISRSALYKRLEAAKVQLLKDNRGRLYATSGQLETLDDLHHHLIHGGRFSDYSPAIAVDVVSEDSRLFTTQSTVQTTVQEKTSSSIELLEKLVGAIASNFSAKSPIQIHQQLAQVESNSWLLTTAEIEQLISKKPLRKKGCDFCQIGGWKFISVGKSGNQLLWKIEKVKVGNA